MMDLLKFSGDVSNFSGTLKTEASGKLHVNFFGTNFMKREIVVGPENKLFLSYKSRDSATRLEDTVILGKGAELHYDGRFKASSSSFFNSVKVIHRGRDSVSDINIRGLVLNKSTVLTTAELLPGSKGSKASINSFAVVFGKGKIKSTPKLLMKEPDATSYHSFKKIYLSPEQVFYLKSRGINENNIEQFYENFILGD